MYNIKVSHPIAAFGASASSGQLISKNKTATSDKYWKPKDKSQI